MKYAHSEFYLRFKLCWVRRAPNSKDGIPRPVTNPEEIFQKRLAACVLIPKGWNLTVGRADDNQCHDGSDDDHVRSHYRDAKFSGLKC